MQALEHNIMALSRKGRWLFIGFLAILFLGVAGGLITLSNMFTTSLPEYGGTYHEGIVGSPRFINPVLAFSDADHDLTSLVYNGLVRLDDSGELIPDLASSWTISPDGKIYTFTLKDQLVFHDGKPLTAYDVIFTVESIQNPILKSPLKIPWTGIHASAPDEKTVVFELPKAYAGFLNQATLGILPAHIWDSFTSIEEWQTSHYNTEPIGSGPFRAISIKRSKTGVPQKYTLQSFKRFAMGKPFIGTLVISSFANTTDATEAFIAHDIDGLASVNPEDAQRAGTSDIASTTQSAPRVFSLFLNGEKNILLKDTAVVQALKLLAPKEELISEVFFGYADPLKGPLPIFTDDGELSSEERAIEARTLLDKAGWQLNETTGNREKAGQPLTFVLATANTADLRKSAEIIAREFHKEGVQIQLQFFELGTLQENIIRKRDFEILLFGQVIKHDTDLFAFWHSSQRTDPGLNIVNYFNTKSDRLLDSALTETDRNARIEIYSELETELEKGPVVFLYTPRTILLTHNRVNNISLPPLSQPSDRFATIADWYIRTDRVWNIFAH